MSDHHLLGNLVLVGLLVLVVLVAHLVLVGLLVLVDHLVLVGLFVLVDHLVLDLRLKSPLAFASADDLVVVLPEVLAAGIDRVSAAQVVLEVLDTPRLVEVVVVTVMVSMVVSMLLDVFHGYTTSTGLQE